MPGKKRVINGGKLPEADAWAGERRGEDWSSHLKETYWGRSTTWRYPDKLGPFLYPSPVPPLPSHLFINTFPGKQKR